MFRQYMTFPSKRLVPGQGGGVDPLIVFPPHLTQHLRPLRPALVGHPSTRWKPHSSWGSSKLPPHGVVALEFRTAGEVSEFRRQTTKSAVEHDIRVGADVGAAPTDHWCPIGESQDLFGASADAERLVSADGLKGLTGKGVNVVIVDRGLNKSGLRNFGGGWPHLPEGSDRWQEPGATEAEDARHGMMIASLVQQFAPAATIYDLPLIPPQVMNVPLFLSTVEAGFHQMACDINSRPGGRDEAWVVVNAWAIFDSRSEHPAGDYTGGTNHQFRALANRLSRRGIDLVFCAGNCGQYCPDDRCGPTDCGPGRSILGVNSYANVLTVGAVRVDGMPLGYSSQGPGQSALCREKPDLVCPSNFRLPHDEFGKCTGTSAACGVAAGVVAALRGRWGPEVCRPAQLIRLLNQGAGERWNPQTGHGILNARRTRELLAQQYPNR